MELHDCFGIDVICFSFSPPCEPSVFSSVSMNAVSYNLHISGNVWLLSLVTGFSHKLVVNTADLFSFFVCRLLPSQRLLCCPRLMLLEIRRLENVPAS